MGDVLDPSGAADNWTVAQITAREEQGAYPFQQVSGNVRSAIFGEKFSKILDDVFAKLHARSEVSIDQSVLAGLRVTGSVSADEAARPNPPAHGH